MREIKFRIWDIDKEEMIYLPHKTRDLVLTDEGWSFVWFPRGNPMPPFKRNLILLQFTGAYDKKNKEIWEEDVVSYSSYATLQNGVIRWDEQSLSFKIDAPFCPSFAEMNYFKKLEVVGNIYENPNFNEVLLSPDTFY